jgi:SAM-dependent methyltransferase
MPDVHFHRDEWFDTVECTSCGLGFINPRPSFAEMPKYYPPEFYGYFEAESKHEVRYSREAEFLGPGGNGRMLLDIGCANGDFPRYMQRRGWHVEGVEVSANSRTINDFPIYNKEFPTLPHDHERYDAITAWAVLEHVHDPKAYFKKAAMLLKPGGRFVFLVTNFDSVSSRHLFREDAPRHLYFFNETTINRYLESAGLKLHSTHYDDRIYQMRPVGWLRYFLYKAFRRNYRFEDIPDNRAEYLNRHGYANYGLGNLWYALSHPFTILDRLTMPFYEKVQIAAKSYGIVTYVATRPIV